MKKILLFAVLTILALSCLHAQSQFILGNLVVYRVGDGTAALSNASTAIFLDEYTTAGTKVQSVAMPTSGASVITSSGSATSEGAMSRSVDTRYLVLCGYGYVPGLTKINGTGDSIPRCIARIDYKAAVDVTTRLGDAYDANNIRSAVTTDGSAFWIAGPSATTGGVRYAKFGATKSTRLANVNTRVVGIFGSQLYATSASSPTYGVISVGTGIPADTGQTAVILNGFPIVAGPSAYGFAMSSDKKTCYACNDSSSTTGIGLQKWTLSGTTWSLAYTISSGVPAGIRHIAVDWSGTNPVIYATDAAAALNHVVKVTDAGSSSAFTTIMTAPANTAFRGIAFAPSATAVGVADQQAPVSFGLLQNYPNPFNPSTTIEFAMPRAGNVTVKVFNVLGMEIASLVNGYRPAGAQSVVWDASHVPSGAYLARLNYTGTSGNTISLYRRMLLVK